MFKVNYFYFNSNLFYRKFIFFATLIFAVYPLLSQDSARDNIYKPVGSFLEDTSVIKISRLSLNSNRSDFCPVFYKRGIIFYSNRATSKKSEANLTGGSEADIFFVDKTNDSFSDPVDFNELIGYGYYEGAFTFYNGFDKMYISKYNSSLSKKIRKNDKLVGLHMFNSDIDTSLNELYTLDPLSFNIHGYSFAHPTTSSDGDVLIFASNIPGSIGGSDLYITQKNKGFWMPPENLGNKINTPFDEYFPYLFQDSILVFSSNKPGGYGKFDVYITTINNTNEPTNLGMPINSDSDDFSLIVSVDGEHGYFTTNRNQNSKEDIYQFEFIKASIQKLVEVIITDRAVDHLNKSYLGSSNKKSVDKEIKKASQVQIEMSLGLKEEEDDDEVSEGSRDSKLQMPEVKQENSLVYRVQVAASKEEISEDEIKRRYKGERPINMFREEGWYKYYIGEFENYFVANKIKKESGVKDAFVVAYIQDDKLVLMDAIRTQYQKEREGNKILIEEVPADWEVLEKQEVFFDFNAFEESSLNSKSLDGIVNILDQNQNYQLAIFAFSDYWGSTDYNLALSAERGKVVKEYLVKNGIEENRILIKSYGEKLSGDKDTSPQLYDKQINRINRKVEFIIYKIK